MPIFAIFAAILVQICWGLNYSASKVAMIDFPPFLAISLRFVLLTIMLSPFVIKYGWPRWRDMAAIGFSTIVLHFALLLVALHMGLNITSCILAVQLGVPFSCMFASVLFKDYLGPWRTGGLVLAFLGILMVAGTPNVYQHWNAFMVMIGAALFWSVGNLYLKFMGPTPVIPLLFWPGVLAMPVMFALSVIFEPGAIAHIPQAHWPSWAAIVYAAAFSSLVGYGLWNWLLTNYPVSHVVPFTLLLPIVGISGGVVFFHDPLSWKLWLGAALILSGVGIIAVRRPKLLVAEEI